MKQTSPLLSIIIPAYNEGKRLPTTLPQVVRFVQAQSYASEIIIVNNNSADETGAIIHEFAQEYEFIRIFEESIQGKGAAVRTGILNAFGDYLFIADADLSMPIEEVSKFLPPQLTDFDVAIGSREAPGAIRYDEPEYRHIMGRVFNFYVKLLAIPGFEDTQCGFKCLRRDVARDVFSSQIINGWAFDVEVLFIALRRGYKIVEIPIHWYYRENSRISPIRDTINMIREVLRIRLNGWNGRYDPPSKPDALIHKT